MRSAHACLYGCVENWTELVGSLATLLFRENRQLSYVGFTGNHLCVAFDDVKESSE